MPRPPSRALRLAAVALPPLLAGCGDDARPAEPPATPVGPESLTVTLVRTPDTLAPRAAGNDLAVRAVARNPTRRPMVARLACPGGGLVVRVHDAAGVALRQAPLVCRGEFRNGVDTVAAGDSVVLQASWGFGVTPAAVLPAGGYTVRATYEAATGRSPSAALPLAVR